MRNEIDGIFFDMDGLMFDTERIGITSWQLSGKKFGFDITDEMVIEAIGTDEEGTKAIFRKYLGYDFDYEEFKRIRFIYTDKIINEQGIPYKKGLLNLLEHVKKLNIKNGIATSTPRVKAEKLLKKSKVLDYFDFLVCGDEVENVKPHPESYIKLAEYHDLDPARCVVLEDSENGLLAASRAKMKPIWIPDIKIPNDEVLKLIYKKFNDLDEVINLLV